MGPNDSLEAPVVPSAASAGSRWEVLGRPRRIIGSGFAAALLVAVVLGVAIPAAVERTLIGARRDVFSSVADDLWHSGLISAALGSEPSVGGLDEAVRDQLLGPDVIRIKLWDESGTIVYSDAADLIGATSSRSGDVDRALAGTPVTEHPGPGEASFAAPDRPTRIHEYYLPVTDDTGAVVAVFEVYEQADSIDATLAATRWMVWISVTLGLAVVVVFLLVLTRASGRQLEWRRLEAERLVASMSRSQEEERVRIMGALHDDIGQPLYRVLHGLQGSQSQLDPSHPVAAELGRLADVVRWIDGALRSELLMLYQGAIDESDIDTLLERLVEDVQSETRLEITLVLGPHRALGEGPRAALFRAVREAVTNVRRHSRASNVTITVTEGSNRIIVDVEDDGIGFDGESGLGLDTTRSRLEAIGGGLRVTGRSGGGTLFRAWVPVGGRS